MQPTVVSNKQQGLSQFINSVAGLGAAWPLRRGAAPGTLGAEAVQIAANPTLSSFLEPYRFCGGPETGCRMPPESAIS